MLQNFTSLHLYFVLGSLAIIIPITYGFVADNKRDHKFIISAFIVAIITVSLFFISDYVLNIISIFK